MHGHGTGRLSKRRRVELSDEEENLRFDTDDGDAINGVTEDGQEEEGEEAEGGSVHDGASPHYTARHSVRRCAECAQNASSYRA